MNNKSSDISDSKDPLYEAGKNGNNKCFMNYCHLAS